MKKMKLTNEFDPIRNWASEKGIYKKGDPKTQYLKLMEEAGELAKALLTNDEPEIIDALGDCTVVLVNLAKLAGYNLEDCINTAYDVIKGRKGKMENGTFVKEAEPKIIGKIIKKKKYNLRLHKNGYYNLPCQHHQIVEFLKTNDIYIDKRLYDITSGIHLLARPSREIGGAAYIFRNDL